MKQTPPLSLGVDDKIGEGDSSLVLNVLPPELCDTAFKQMIDEVDWNVMYHRGGEVPRRVAVEGEIAHDGSFPIYRHPADESPALRQFSPTVATIREHVENILDHPVNHVLIQHYRSGADYISEHSDKTIDVVRGSKIVNVSLGAQRVMTLRLKRDGVQQAGNSTTPRPSQKIPLPHNSMFVLGLDTNAKWLHAINHDRRPIHLKSAEEQFMNGERISLTFRHIGTFLTRNKSRIYGQGARGKFCDSGHAIISGGEEAAKLLEAFGKENQQSDFDWEEVYGEGSDVLHFTSRESQLRC
ncbi:hypothetical protein DFJ58DRAFT_821601 [Suillus subalutaceus]|uniref:uncharacterized protein n=1 Tax=Suillus subalutaceus TaxID=48586 RepID=UPI001B873CC2|nr:uncharacterized protein DFJ58DRAFT_821601 [Suillus subalutaceus]KAG1834315.1 hypothetical protein DFJ58DRAFT_821601 [Suillus subalutaceus]